ncbi:hypothetical protein NX862_13435 [Rhodobacter sp. KR11]|uniref:hypothetical protein n=1 Tax=Rhodobacter sp. KR11 TaxID=2974588 RepID=UPI0022223E2B|nr:hypothetical protein [Rhodobacter sp. KR11]MCW1919759.1 hypothetical protein [Rhodobacter sp. KR11]
MREEIQIRRNQKRLGIPFIPVNHNQEKALSMADRIALIHKGRIKALGARQEIHALALCRVLCRALDPVRGAG